MTKYETSVPVRGETYVTVNHTTSDWFAYMFSELAGFASGAVSLSVLLPLAMDIPAPISYYRGREGI